MDGWSRFRAFDILGGMNMKKKLVVAALTLCGAAVLWAEDKGLPLFSDNFDAEGTFAEQWVSKKCLPKDGKVRVSDFGSLTMRGATPLEFVAEADITLCPSWSTLPPAKEQQGWGGFSCAGNTFCIQPCGKSFMVWRVKGQTRSDGRYLPIEGIGPGKTARLMLMRKKAGEGCVKYAFWVNGKPVYDFINELPKKAKGADGQESYAAVNVIAYKVDLDVDNFVLSGVRHDDDSPNTVYNSGFEYTEDNSPTHYGLRGMFDFVNWPWEKFHQDYLKRYQVDTAEKHSGKQSLRVIVNGASESILINPWRPGTVKGAAGVFSVWMKANKEGVKVTLGVDPGWVGKVRDGSRTVEVGREWARYEVTRASLAGRGIYSPLSISVPKPAEQDALLWIDDLQFEIVSLPEGGFDPAKTYATPYKPSELDKDRFGEKKELPPPATLTVKKLPAGVKPTVDLDTWTDKAAPISEFWFGKNVPQNKTEGFLACDDDNLYVGMRNFGEKAESADQPRRSARDLDAYTSDGLEIFFKPNPDEGYFHLAMAANGDQFDLHANDMKWNGAWTVVTKVNAAAGATDYLVTIPFADLAPWGMAQTWLANFCRNDRAVKGSEQYVASGKAESPNFRNEERWNTLALPADVIARWADRASKKRTDGADAVLGRLDFYMNEEFAQWRVTGADGKTTVVKKPLAEIPMGTNVVSFTANGKTYKDTVVKLPYKKGATQVNRWTRSIVHDGHNEVFTGIGIGGTGYFGYTKDANPFIGMFDMLKADGFRHFLFMASSRSPRMPEAKACLEESAKRGFLCAFWSDYDIWNYDDDMKHGKLKPIDDVPMEKMVEFVRPYDHVVTHLVIDEPELYKPSAWTRAWLEKLKAYFPYTPVQMNNTVMGIPSKYADLKTDILMLDDYLTNNEGRTVESVVKAVDVMQAAPGGKPCWYFIIGDNMSMHYKNPSYAEQVAQSWGCICAGCTGLSWYFGLPSTEGDYRAMVDVNREVQALAPVILSEELCDAATADQPKKKLRHLTRTLDGTWYVLSCNIDAKPLTATFTLPKDAPRNGTVEVLFENRTLPLKDGVFRDDYPAHFRHLYRVRE